VKTTLHEIPLERRTLHGHFSRDLEPVAEVRPGDVIRFATLDAGWGVEPPREDGSQRERFSPLDEELDAGHALIGPVAVLSAVAGQTLAVGIEEVRVGPFGLSVAGGWSTPLNDRLGVGEGETRVLAWDLDADAGVGRDRDGREVSLAPFLGVLGMPPPEPGVHETGPPRVWGGNLDCKELVVGTTLFLPIPVDGALFSAGDGHALQGDGELNGNALETPMDVEFSVDLIRDQSISGPRVENGEYLMAMGLAGSLDDAFRAATSGLAAWLEKDYGLTFQEAAILMGATVEYEISEVADRNAGIVAKIRKKYLPPRAPAPTK
jgi:acetamidase/formamidase